MKPILITKGISLKPVLLINKINEAGEAPISICIYIRRQRTYKNIGYRVNPDHWDEDSGTVKGKCPNAGNIRSELSKKLGEYEKELRLSYLSNEPITITKVRKYVRLKPSHSNSFYEYTKELIEDLKLDFSGSTIRNYEAEFNRLFGYEKDGKFIKGYADKNLTFADIDTYWLRKYKSWLMGKNFKVTKTGYLKNNTVHKVFKILKKIFNKAIQDRVTKYYPFAEYSECPVYKQTDRTWLTESEVNRIEDLLKTPIPDYFERTIYYFLLGCYSGLRYSDWVKFNYNTYIVRGLSGDRLITRTTKTGTLVSMPVHEKLKVVIDKLKELPPVDCEQKVNEYLKAIAKLAKIDKNVTTHQGRYAFAVRCAELGISIDSTAELMGISVRTCRIYYKITARKLDSEMKLWDKNKTEKKVEKMAAV